MRKLFLLSFIFLILLVVPLISAQPPTTTQVVLNLDSGLNIEVPRITTLEQSQDFFLSLHVYNITNGQKVDNISTNCGFELFQHNGTHLFEIENLRFVGDEWQILVEGNNFSRLGEMYYIVDCISTTEGGVIPVHLQITPTGTMNAFGLQIFLFIFLFGLVLLGFFIKNEWIVILGGMGLIALGIFSLTQGISDFRNDLTQMVSLVTIGIGAIVSIVTALQVIYDEL